MSELARLDAPLMVERDHPVRPWVVAGALLVAILLVASAFYYSPLVAAGPTRCPEEAELVPAPESEDGTVGQELCLVGHAPGRDMTFGTAVRNDGRLPITVAGLDFDSAVLELVEVHDVLLGHADGAAEPAPFAPFRLAPGEERLILVEATLRPCEPGRDGRLVSLPALPVRTSFFGVPKTAAVPLTNELSVLLADCGSQTP